MKWSVAVTAALVTVSAQAKVLECRLPGLKDPMQDLQKMVIKVTEQDVAIHHQINYPNVKTRRNVSRDILYRHNADVFGSQFTFFVLEETLGQVKYPPLLVTVSWSTGSLQTSLAHADHWEQRWVCLRMD